MASTSWPSPTHNSRAVTDREYEQLVSSYTGDGLVGDPTESAAVYADGTGMAVRFRANKLGLVRAQMWSSGATEFTKPVTANGSGALRQDLVVLRLTRATWAVTEEVKAGAPGAGLPAVSQDLNSSGVFEIPIAVVRVETGATVIQPSDVTPIAWYLNEPEYLCTSTTMPPAVSGRRAYQTNTGHSYVAVGSTWQRIPDERAGLGELGPFTLPPFGPITGSVVLFDQTVTCRPSHFHNIAVRLRPQASSSYTHLMVFTEIAGTVVQHSGADLINGLANVPAEKTYHALGWRSGSTQTSFQLRVTATRYTGGSITATEAGQVSIVDLGSGAGAGHI
jgi:hypothetical protein